MTHLFVTTELSNLFLGGLLAVARADGIVKPEEMEALRTTALEKGFALPSDEDLLLAEDVTPEALATAVRASAGAVYRTGASTPEEIALGFLEAALRLALADHELVIEEAVALRELAAALDAPTERIAGWRAVSAFEEG